MLLLLHVAVLQHLSRAFFFGPEVVESPQPYYSAREPEKQARELLAVVYVFSSRNTRQERSNQWAVKFHHHFFF